MQNNFFGSKLNSVLLLILIILLGFVLYFMYQEKATYLPFVEEEKKKEVDETDNLSPIKDNSQIQGNKEDLISFSILPNTEVKGIVSYRGEIKGGYFFEANILVAVTDINKKVIKQSNGISTTDWMTAGPVKFEGNMDFSKLPKGKAYLKISQDDPSNGESGKTIKEIFIPIIIK